MKKLIALFLSLIMVFSLCSCQGKISAEERSAANEIIEKLNTVFTTHQNANEDVLTANSLTASSGCETKMSDLTSRLKYVSHDEFVEALASVVALLADEEGGDANAVYEMCMSMEDPSEIFSLFDESFVPNLCGMAIQAHTSVLSGTDEILEQAKSELDAFAEKYPDSEILAPLEAYCKAVTSFSGYCGEYAFLITDSAASEIRILESICETAKTMLDGSDSKLPDNAQLVNPEE
ncbi:MAG: hypothetical protein E7479_02035 [Ruminococcaceae bacterium]|nr:hypothetical protein [Oscillospiraceae bacterium]